MMLQFKKYGLLSSFVIAAIVAPVLAAPVQAGENHPARQLVKKDRIQPRKLIDVEDEELQTAPSIAQVEKLASLANQVRHAAGAHAKNGTSYGSDDGHGFHDDSPTDYQNQKPVGPYHPKPVKDYHAPKAKDYSDKKPVEHHDKKPAPEYHAKQEYHLEHKPHGHQHQVYAKHWHTSFYPAHRPLDPRFRGKFGPGGNFNVRESSLPGLVRFIEDEIRRSGRPLR